MPWKECSVMLACSRRVSWEQGSRQVQAQLERSDKPTKQEGSDDLTAVRQQLGPSAVRPFLAPYTSAGSPSPPRCVCPCNATATPFPLFCLQSASAVSSLR